MTAKMNFITVDEIILARKTLHGGGRGAPRILNDSSRQGSALNQACVFMLSATLQAYVEDTYVEASSLLRAANPAHQNLAQDRDDIQRWGNPSPSNITRLFQRLNIPDVLAGLSWQKQSNAALRNNLDELNQLRNDIAHVDDLRINGVRYRLKLNRISRWRAVCEKFGREFGPHVHRLAKPVQIAP